MRQELGWYPLLKTVLKTRNGKHDRRVPESLYCMLSRDMFALVDVTSVMYSCGRFEHTYDHVGFSGGQLYIFI